MREERRRAGSAVGVGLCDVGQRGEEGSLAEISIVTANTWGEGGVGGGSRGAVVKSRRVGRFVEGGMGLVGLVEGMVGGVVGIGGGGGGSGAWDRERCVRGRRRILEMRASGEGASDCRRS